MQIERHGNYSKSKAFQNEIEKGSYDSYKDMKKKLINNKLYYKFIYILNKKTNKYK
jgi:hypothetical protein